MVCDVCLFSYSYGGYASGESPQVAAQPVYGVSVQQVTSWFIHGWLGHALGHNGLHKDALEGWIGNQEEEGKD